MAANHVPYFRKLKSEDPARLAEIVRKGARCPARLAAPRKARGAPKHLSNRQWQAQREEAAKVAEHVVSVMEFEDALPGNAIAREAILSAVTMLATDLTSRQRLAVIRVLLEFNLARPATVQSVSIRTAEDWIADLVATEAGE